MLFTISHTNARYFHSKGRKCLSGTLEGLNCVYVCCYFFLNFTTGKHWIMKQSPRNTHVSNDFCFQLVLIFWYDQFYFPYNGNILTYIITCKPNSDSAMWGEKLFVCWWKESGTKHIRHFSAFILYPTVFLREDHASILSPTPIPRQGVCMGTEDLSVLTWATILKRTSVCVCLERAEQSTLSTAGNLTGHSTGASSSYFT